MANKASSITATHLRVTRLGPDGKFLTDAKASFVTKSFISLSFSPEYEDGDEFTQKNAAGAVCATYKAPGSFQRVLSDVVDQPFAHAPKDGLLHDSDLLGETLT